MKSQRKKVKNNTMKDVIIIACILSITLIFMTGIAGL